MGTHYRCWQTEEESEAFLLGHLDRKTANAVGAHLLNCARCRALAQKAQNFILLIRAELSAYLAPGQGSEAPASVAMPNVTKRRCPIRRRHCLLRVWREGSIARSDRDQQN